MKEDRFMEMFDSLEKRREIALVPFILIGYPTLKASIEIVKAAVQAGADALEIGIPFSDPIADGAALQKAHAVALANRVNRKKVFKAIAKIRKFFSGPIAILCYGNLVYSSGIDNFYRNAKKSGCDALIIPDVPLEEIAEFERVAKEYSMKQILLCALNSSTARVKKIAKHSNGFIYLVSSLGTTGSRKKFGHKLKSKINEIKKLTRTPLCVGFGISKAEHVENLAALGADGAIIGSVLCNFIERKDTDGLSQYIKDMKKATKFRRK